MASRRWRQTGGSVHRRRAVGLEADCPWLQDSVLSLACSPSLLTRSGCYLGPPHTTFCLFMPQRSSSILSQVALLEQVEALVPMLDSTHIKGTFWGLHLLLLIGEVGWAGLPEISSALPPCLYPHLREFSATCTRIKICQGMSSASGTQAVWPKDTQGKPSGLPLDFFCFLPRPLQHLSFRVLQGQVLL